MPDGRLAPDQPVVAPQPLLLVVEQRLDRADVKDRQPAPRPSQGLRDQREEGRLGLAPGGRGQDQQVGALQGRVDGQLLHRPQRAPAQGVDDLVLQGRVEPVERLHSRPGCLRDRVDADADFD